MQKLAISTFINTTLLFSVLAVLWFIPTVIEAQVEASMEAQASSDARADTRDDYDAEYTACTADAYQCPNGEWVGRTGPNCEFVCADDPVSDREIEVIEDEDGSDRNEPGQQVAPSQTKVIIMPSDANDEGGAASAGLSGLEIDFRDEDSDDDGLADGTEAVGSGRGLVSVRVDGATVRGWDAETKAAIRTRLQEANSQNEANDFGLFVAMQAIDHEDIEHIKVEESTATVTFQTRLNFLGFIPVNVTASTIAQSNGEVKTSYPWWSFLAGKSESDKVSVFSTIAASLATRIAIEEEGIPAVDEKHN